MESLGVFTTMEKGEGRRAVFSVPFDDVSMTSVNSKKGSF